MEESCASKDQTKYFLYLEECNKYWRKKLQTKKNKQCKSLFFVFDKE